MSEESKAKFNIPWDTTQPCRVQGEQAPTRLDTNFDEEFDGELFDGMCPELDPNIPKLKDNFIDFCPVDLPDIPKALLKLKKFNQVPFSGVPTAEIPKVLLSRLLPCCLKGRTTGFDIDIEQDLDGSGKPVNIDPDQALLPISIQFGDRGMLKLGIDIAVDSCFCDESCGPEDYLKIKVRSGAKYVPFEGNDDLTDSPSTIIKPDDLSKLFYTNIPPGAYAQIVDYEPLRPSPLSKTTFNKLGKDKYYECKTEVWGSVNGSTNSDSADESNRWKYKIRFLEYTDSGFEVLSGDDNPSLVFPAYNLNEYSANYSELPTGISSNISWWATYDEIVNNKTVGQSRALPIPIGSVVYVIDTSPLDRCKTCEDCEPPILLFYKQNRDAPTKRYCFVGRFIRYGDNNQIIVKPIDGLEEDNEEIPVQIPPIIRKEEMPPLKVIVCYLGGNGMYWGVPYGFNDDDGTVVDINYDRRSLFAVYYSGTYREVDLSGEQISYDSATWIEESKVGVAPYISPADAPKSGGIYLLQWFKRFKKWVIISGSCAKMEFQNYTMVNISMHVTDSTIDTVTPESGSITISQQDDFAVVESWGLKHVRGMQGYSEVRSSNMFAKGPEFAIGADRNSLTYSNIVLRPGAAGYAAYNVIINGCQGRSSHVIVFKCLETNHEPTVTLYKPPVIVKNQNNGNN